MRGRWAMRIATEDAGQYIGAGVLLIDEKGSVFGGDNGYWWAGFVSHEHGGIFGALNVTRYIKDAQPPVPVADPNFYSVNFEGGFDPKSFWAGGFVVGQEHLKFAVELMKLEEDDDEP